MRRQQARCLVAAVDRRRLFFVVAAAARALVVSALPTRSSSVPPTAPSSSSLSLVVPRVPAPPRIARVCLSLGCCYYASPIPKERLCLLLSPVETTTTTTVRRRLLFCPCLDLASMISRRLSGRRRKRKTYFSTRSRQSSSVLIIRCCFNKVVRVRSDDDTMNKGNHQRDDDKIVCTQNTVRALHSRERSARKKEGSLFYTRTNDGGLTPRVQENNEKKISESIAARALSREKSVDAYLFTLLRFHVHELMHCNLGKKSRKGSVFALVMLPHNASRPMIFPPVVREKLKYERDDDYTHCTLTPTRLTLRRRRISAKQTARPLCSDR